MSYHLERELFLADPEFEDEWEWLDEYDFEQEAEVDRNSREYVKWVQRSLNQMMGAGLTVDGVTGQQTRRAVASFQRRRAITVNGKVGTQTERSLIAAGASPPPTTSASSRSLSLLHTESTPPGLTLYVSIPLGSESPAKPMTGIFLPTGYRLQPKVDLVLYLHGNKNNPQGTAPVRQLSIKQYWNKTYYPDFALREGVNASGKNVILVAPTLGPKSEAGYLTELGGLDAYLNQVIASLSTYGPYKRLQKPPSLGNVILACHSGGGLPMRQLALSKNTHTSKIRECWGFDCTYNPGDDTEWPRWAKINPTAKLYIVYITRSKTAPLATRLKSQAKKMGLSNVFVTESTTRNHNRVPITYWESLLKASSFLRNK